MAMLEGELGGLCSEYSAIKGTVDQRLKWAVGANPGLQEVVDQAAGEQQVVVFADQNVDWRHCSSCKRL